MPQKKINGIQVDALVATIGQIKEKPEMAQFKFRAINTWVGGTHSRAAIKDFYGVCKEDASRDPAIFDLDEPPVLLGGNKGINPVEYLLVALSGCLTTSLIAYASVKGIAIRGLESRYEGELDLRGFLGITQDVPVGYRSIRIFFKIDADIPREQKQELLQLAQKYSPVYNSLAHPVPVSVDLDTQ